MRMAKTGGTAGAYNALVLSGAGAFLLQISDCRFQIAEFGIPDFEFRIPKSEISNPTKKVPVG